MRFSACFGASTLFSYANDPPLGPTDIVAIEEDVPYTTRLIVRRPVDPRRFNGTVVVEWWNSTAGFDTAPSWDPSAEYFERSSTSSIHAGARISSPSCGP